MTPLCTSAPRLHVHGLQVSRNGTPIVRVTELRLEAGQLVWLGGASGTGKTTLLLALARLLPCDAGEMTLDGVAAAHIPAPQWRAQVLLAPHPPQALATTVESSLLVPFRLHAARPGPPPTRQQLLAELAALGLGEVSLERSATQLSQGQLGRLALARALLVRPPVLLLDEPSANLDPAAAARVEARVAAYCAAGGAVIAAAHGAPWQIPRGTLHLDAPPRPHGTPP